MNCANHPDIAAVAYCRTCGKPLCANCTRDVRGVIYCENCLAERLQGVQPPAPASPLVTDPVVRSGGSGPNPALAGILAGFFPFGVGAVYCGQYAKGLAHLLIFTMLVWGENLVHNDGLHAVLGLSLAFFYIYQIIDAVRTAKAIQLGLPIPDPFGLAQTFGAAVPSDGASSGTSTSKIPTAAVVLIGLGIIFLLHTTNLWFFNIDRLWPLILIGLGVWLFARNRGMLGPKFDRYGRPCRRSLVGSAVLFTVGTLSLIENLNGPHWDRTWPLLLLAIGVVKLMERTAPQPPTSPLPPMPGVTETPVQPSTTYPEVKNG